MRRTPPVVAMLVVLFAAAPAAAAAVPARTVRLVSAGPLATSSGVFADAISADGSRAIFETMDRLAQADTNGDFDIYARDTNGRVQLISDGVSTADAAYLGMSANGDRVWFATAHRELAADTDASRDIYERRRNGSLRLISSPGPVDIPVQQWVDGSDDGSHVLFWTAEKVPGSGDSDNALDLFDRRADGSVRLVTPRTALDANVPFGSPANQHVISADGTHATFFTLESLTPGDTGTFGDTYSVPLAGGAFKLVTTSAPSESVNGITNRAGTRTWFTTKAKVLRPTRTRRPTSTSDVPTAPSASSPAAPRTFRQR